MPKGKITTEKLAAMVQQGFEVSADFANTRFDSVEKQLAAIRRQLQAVDYESELNILTRRVGALEKKVAARTK